MNGSSDGEEKGHSRQRDQYRQSLEATEQVPIEGAPPKRSLLMCVLSLPGGRDRAGRPLLLVSTTKGPWEVPWCTASEVTKLFSYLCTIPR